jgi:RNA-directed DNA polymerase
MLKPTEFRVPTETKLNRIAWLSSRDEDKVFENLMHLYNKESLRGCFSELDGKKAVGIDGVDKAMYDADLPYAFLSQTRQGNGFVLSLLP